MKTWSTDYTQFMRDHDRPDGRMCRLAQRQKIIAAEVYEEYMREERAQKAKGKEEGEE
jgi:hypothetical protein